MPLSNVETRLGPVAAAALAAALSAAFMSCSLPGMSPEHVGPLAEREGRIPGGKAPAAPSGPVRIDVTEAILLSLENNPSFRIARLKPALARTSEAQAQAAYDPVLGGGLSWGRSVGKRSSSSGSGLAKSAYESGSGEVTVGGSLPTGTSVEIAASTEKSNSNGDALAIARVGLTVNQPVLRGASIDANLASIRQAEIDTRVSEYELRGAAEALVAEVEKAYWDFALAQKELGIYAEALKVAEQHLKETEVRVSIGKLPQIEIAAARAQFALRNEDMINARSGLSRARLRLLRLLNSGGEGQWDREIELAEWPVSPNDVPSGPAEHVKVALAMRPDLNQARLAAARSELELVKTRNGLLPRLDLFVTLGKSGYSDSFTSASTAIGGGCFDASIGLSFEYPVANLGAQAAHQKALISRKQVREALRNLEQIVEVDVRGAIIEVTRSREQIAATMATRTAWEEALTAEEEKFRVGKSTSFLVAQAEKDAVSSRIAEVRAVVNTLKSIVDLYRLDGSLLVRRGISAPGLKPAANPSE